MEVVWVEQVKAALYHTATNGLVERFNGPLKSMLGMSANRRDLDRDEMLP